VMIKSAPGGIVELTARTLQAPGKAWIDLAIDSVPLTLEVMQTATGGVLYAEELGRLSRLQQKNLLFAAERLEKFGLRLVAATALDTMALLAQGWEEAQLARLFDVWLGAPTLLELRDEIPEIATHLITHLGESGEVSPRRLSTGALNALRQHAWQGGYGELKSAVKSLALTALEDEISAEDVARLLAPNAAPEAPTGLSDGVMALPLREAREIFERMYFEHHLRQESGNITRLSEKTGLERTHLYRKLKDLGLRAGRKEEE
jgi:two-component system, NtrC family, nitrogen regulation response regulator NtrX